MDPTKYRKNKETTRKPYRSNAAFYTDYKDEIPDGDYYGLKHSEFKKPWLPASGYDEMEYLWDFPLEYLNPISGDFEVPDMGIYKFPDAPTVNPNWTPPRWNPQYPTPEFPKPKPYAKKKPGANGGTQIVWTYCEGQNFEFCPGETVPVTFTEYTTDRIESVDAGEGEIIPPATGRLGESKHRPGYPEGTFTVAVKIPETAGMTYDVTSTTKSGETCVSIGTQRSSCQGGCEGVSIGYTTTQMPTGTSQTLTINNADPNTLYEWELSGGGSTTEQKGTSTVFTAPESNPDCASTPTISLKNAATGEICVTLKIGVSSEATATYTAFRYFEDLGVLDTDIRPGMAPFCTDVHWEQMWSVRCDGTSIPFENRGLCWGPETYACSPTPGWTDADQCDFETKFDIRTPEMIKQGCCPSELV